MEKVQNLFKEEMNDASIIQYQATHPAALDQVVNQIVATLGIEATASLLKQPQKPTDTKDFIVLEGANGSGKSTLAKLLKINMVGWSTKTLDYQDTDHFMRYLKAYSLNQATIFDRGHLSEVVYAQLFRNGDSFSAQELALLNEYVARRGTLIFCNPPLERIKERVRNATYPKHIREDALTEVVSLFKNLLEL